MATNRDRNPSPIPESNSKRTELKEHEPLTSILEHIPLKVQRGLQMQYEDLELTAIDVNASFMVFGTNVRTVFLFDRHKHEMQRLKAEDSNASVSSVALHHGLDDLVAVGYSSGTVYIFQLPSMLIGHSKKLERFIVSDIHTSPIKCLAWSMNGMRLFTGDTKGCVGITDVDFYEADTEIVQLHHGHRSLLISTRHRCIVCRMDSKDSITQIGSKDRKIQGDYGGCFIPAMCKVEDAKLYATRPGLRVWKASISGTVVNTYIFKELLAAPHPQIPLLDFKVTNIVRPPTVSQFGPLLLFRDRDLVTWNETTLYVLNSDSLEVVASQTNMGLIRGVVVTEGEIFVLRHGTSRNVVRIAESPMEVHRSHHKVKHIGKPSVIKDKNQEKLLSNATSDLQKPVLTQVTSNPSQSDTSAMRDMSSPELLPPVVKLNSPDFLKIEVNIEGLPSPVQTPTAETAIGQASSSDTKTHSNQPSESVPDETSVMGQREGGSPIQMSRHLEKRFVEGDKETRILDRVMVHGEEDDGDIVFNRKLKIKHKKKKRVSKERQATEGDSVSIHSTTSVNSAEDVDNNSSNMPQGPEVKPAHSTELPQAPVNIATDTHVTQGPTEEPVEPVVSQTVLEKKVTSDSESKISTEQSEDTQTSKLSSTNKNVSDKNSDTTVCDISEDNQNIVPKDDKTVEPDSVTTASVSCHALENRMKSDTCVSENEQDKSEKPENVPDLIPKTAEKPLSTDIDSIESHTRTPDVLSFQRRQKFSLDLEISRLNSYLSEPGSSQATDIENSLSFSGQTQADSILLSTGRRKEVKSIGMGQATLVEDRIDGYEPSKLEKAIAELEKVSEEPVNSETNALDSVETDKSSLTSRVSPKSPSIYSIYGKPETSDSTPDDFYSKYRPTSLSFVNSSLSEQAEGQSHRLQHNAESSNRIQFSPRFLRAVNNWTEITANGNIYSLSVSATHVWITDRSTNIFYSSLTGPGIAWKKPTGNASQISVSPDGNIVWGLYKGTVSAGTKITAKRPEGMKWVEAVRDVSYISVDDTCAWYIKTNHQVMVQIGLSKERPCYKGEIVDTPHRLKQIVCREGVVWALTEKCLWLYRSGITQDRPQGNDWKTGDSGKENRLFCEIALGEGDIGLALDVLGQVWFVSGVTRDKPKGDNQWWQVPLNSEYLMQDSTALDMLKSFSRKFDPQQLTTLITSQTGGLLSGQGGVWVCPEYKNVLHVCRGSVEGQQWREAHPDSLAMSSWKLVEASNVMLNNSHVWAMQPNGDIFAFTSDGQNCTCIEAPRSDRDPLNPVTLVCLSACTQAIWALNSEGQVYIRTGVSTTEPRGSGWAKLDLAQLVDSDGRVFHRIGVRAPSELSLNAAWLPVDNGGTVFTQIVSGQQDWKVWALDNRRQVFVRDKVTAEMPIGRKWIHVSAKQISMSNNFVWALNHAGELLCRYGITQDNITGEFWKKIPGNFSYISATPTDTVWAITKEGQLVRRFTRYIMRTSKDQEDSPRKGRTARDASVCSDDGDWELEDSPRKGRTARDASVCSDDGDWELVDI
ncbi:TCPR2-like protein [Mya arenaria]|uniref:TCPR2-like protein n=1 Tax=Mya arenaria TaxID=6604 RepID=A0ABY7FCR4_MYAAR|nr:TCPR2-like protein [Mya arenaria]